MSCVHFSQTAVVPVNVYGVLKCRGRLVATLNPGNAPGRRGRFAPFLRGKLHGPEAIEGRFPQKPELSQFRPGRWGGAVVSPGGGQCVFLCLGQWAGSTELIVTPREVGTWAEGKWDRAKDLSGGFQPEHPDLSDGCTERPVPCIQSCQWARPSGHLGGHGLGLGLLGGVSASSQALISSLGGWEAQGTAGRPLPLCLQVGTQAVAPSQAAGGKWGVV